ncbi:MAG: type I DNA topoisomerase [Candidatus Yanofskybacteria bacterium]|nr:type I DNA topoisomerase [Candidatus Yanofskybacteria bacterium]
MSSLIIVESPTKARTISKFLGSEYSVLSSFGHVRDLPKSSLGVDVEHGFKPKYTIPAKAKKVVAELKESVEKSDSVVLATDGDREGEAIAWHLVEALKLDAKKTGRIVFHEITKSALLSALKSPRGIDYNLVDAQQARRVLDRLVGYGLSPFLWKKIKPGLSAGRVQSVALRLVVEREREIKCFIKDEYWTIEADLLKKDEEKPFRAKLIKIGEKSLDKFYVKNKEEAETILKNLEGATYQVADISHKEVVRNPAPPFTTSTLQQEASRKLGFSAKQTMMTAQRLYETGHITYMRTDSVNLAESVLAQAKEAITNIFGGEYALSSPRRYTTKSKGAQEAHEAVRPTDLTRKPDELKGLERSQARLYELIWKRTVACQMQPAFFDQTSVDVGAMDSKFTFRATGQVMKFDGFIRAYTEGRDDDSEEDGSSAGEEGRLPALSVSEQLVLAELLPIQHFTEPPPRYSDATLIKALESHGVGRPSTYAPTLATIQDRGYVEKIEKKYYPTEIGFLVNDMLVENFPEVVDINFTSHIEEELDDIAEGKIKWVPVIEEFYTPFKKNLEEKIKSVEKLVEISDTPCPHCGKMMIIKFGRSGKFLACPEPGSKVTQPLPEEAAKIKELEEKTKGERCPICGKLMQVKRGRFGYFLGCSDYPDCKGIDKIFNKTGFKCPNCRAQQDGDPFSPEDFRIEGQGQTTKIGDIVERKSRGRGRIFYGCSRFPDCNFLVGQKPENEEALKAAFEEWKKNPPKTKARRTLKNREK